MQECEKKYYPNGALRSECYLEDGKYHRELLPAKIFYHDNRSEIGGYGSKMFEFYFKAGKAHRDNLPAVIGYDVDGRKNSEIYCKDGMYHRENGPAVIYYHKDGNIEYKYLLFHISYTDKNITDNWEDFCKIHLFR